MDYSKNKNAKRKREINSKSKKVKNKVGVVAFRIAIVCVLILCFSAGGAVVGAYLGVIENSPKLSFIDKAPPGSYTTIIYSAETGEELDRLNSGENREFASIEEIPMNLRNAFVAIEDERFYSHDGVDVKGLFRAVYNNLTNPDNTQGASTITQQFIKNKLNIKRNSWDTKLQEQYLAVEFEKNLKESLGGKEEAKEYILEQYLNEVGLGAGQKGVKAGAKHYFNKELGDLTLAECAVIASITQNPTMRSPINEPDSNRERQVATLDKMLELEFITEDKHEQAINEDVYAKITKVKEDKLEAPSFHSYFNDAIIEQVISDLQATGNYTRKEASDYFYSGGLSVYSTQDTSIQKIVDDAFMNEELFPSTEFEIDVTYTISVYNTVTGETTHHEKKTTAKTQEDVTAFTEKVKDELLGQSGEVLAETLYAIPQPQAAMVIMDYRTGQVKAIAGGRGAKVTNRGLNRATQSERQPGSVFKVLASFAPAIDMGLITPATVIDDAPFTIKEPGVNYSPTNWYGGFRGPRTVRIAIRDSMNVITVKNMYNTGLENCINYLYRFGFSTLTPSDHVYAACLGGISGINQLEVTAAYGAIANDGMYNKPILYTKVVDHEGKTILDNTLKPEPILKKTSAYLLTNMMQDVVTSGTGTKARFKEVKMPIAGKTGTTTGTKDLTFVGYTPYYVSGIWLGYDMPKDMNPKTEGVHSQLWSYVMEKVHANLEYRDFERPDGIVTAKICVDSGKLATSECSNDPRAKQVRSEVFAEGTQPTDHCDVHTTYNICTVSGKIPNEFCPAEFVQSRVGIISKTPPAPDKETGEIPAQYVPSAIVDGHICDIHNASFQGDTGVPFVDNPLVMPQEPTPTQSNNEPITPSTPSTPYDEPIDQQPNSPASQPVTMPATPPPPTPKPTPQPTQRPDGAPPQVNDGPLM